MYNAATDKWTQAASSLVERTVPGLVTVNGRIFLLGDYSGKTDIVEEFLPSSNTWQVFVLMLIFRQHQRPIL